MHTHLLPIARCPELRVYIIYMYMYILVIEGLHCSEYTVLMNDYSIALPQETVAEINGQSSLANRQM